MRIHLHDSLPSVMTWKDWLPDYFYWHLLLTENVKLEMSFKTFRMIKVIGSVGH